MADTKDTLSLVDELSEILNKGLSDGDLEDRSPPPFLLDQSGEAPQDGGGDAYHEMREEEIEDEEERMGKDPVPDYTDLDTDFEWKYMNDMQPGKRPWPIRDTSILFDPAAITRYNVDYYRLVARLERVADVLRKLSSVRKPRA